MKRLLFILLASAWLWPAGLHAQSDALKSAFENYQELNEQGRYREAIPYAQEALTLAEEEYGPENPAVALVLNDLAHLYYKQSRYGEAEPLFKRSLAIIEKR